MLTKRVSKRSPDQTAALQKYDFTYSYGTQTIQYSVWVTGSADRIKTIVFLGTVQIGKLPVWIAESCPDGTAVVQGAPHWLALDDGSDIPEFMYQFTEEAFKSILKTFTVENVHVIADSQAAPCAVSILADHKTYVSKVQSIVLLQPLGLNTSAFAGTTEDRVRIFKQRITQNIRYQLPTVPHDSRLRYNIRQMLQTIGYNNAKWKAQYNSGLEHDIIEDLRRLYVMPIRLAVVCGERDMLFPPHELQAVLHMHKLDIPLLTVRGVPHSPLAAKQGAELLKQAFQRLELA